MLRFLLGCFIIVLIKLLLVFLIFIKIDLRNLFLITCIRFWKLINVIKYIYRYYFWVEYFYVFGYKFFLRNVFN